MKEKDLIELAKLILLQVNHNKECGKDDKFTIDEIASMIDRRVVKKMQPLSQSHEEYKKEFQEWIEKTLKLKKTCQQFLIDAGINNEDGTLNKNYTQK